MPGRNSIRSLIIVAVLVLATGAATAQPFGTDLIVGDHMGNVFRVSPTGTTTIGAYAPSGRYLWDLTLDVSDRNAIVSIAPLGLSSGELVSIDIASGIATTILSGVGSVLTRLDENGDFMVSALRRMMHVDRATQAMTTLHTSPTVPLADRDVNTGNWVIADLTQLFHFDPSTGSIVNTLAMGTSGSLSFAVDPSRPEAYAANFALHRVDTRTGATTKLSPVIGLGPVGDQALAVDRAPDAGGEVLYFYASTSAGNLIQRVDRTGTVLGTVARFKNQVAGFAFDRGRNLAAVLNVAPNDRSVVVSFANAGGLFYTVVFSLSGISPGVNLPDGRRVALNIDTLTALTLSGPVPPFIKGNTGRLGASGRSGLTLNLNTLGKAVRGVRLWAVAVVFDPAAPLGIAQISAPLVIVL